jgi:hypothetical protein
MVYSQRASPVHVSVTCGRTDRGCFVYNTTFQCGPESPCFLAKHEEFCTAKGLAFKLLSDGDGSVSKSYGADLKIPILVRGVASRFHSQKGGCSRKFQALRGMYVVCARACVCARFSVLSCVPRTFSCSPSISNRVSDGITSQHGTDDCLNGYGLTVVPPQWCIHRLECPRVT